MRRNLFALLLLMLATPLLSTGQTRRGNTIADVPFSFIVDDQQLPPGRYILSPVGEATIRISNSATKAVIVVTHAESRAHANGNKIVFHRYGGRTFLSSIWISGSSVGREVYPSRAELQLIQQGRETEIAELSLLREPGPRSSRP